MSANDRKPPDKEVTGGRIETGPDADADADAGMSEHLHGLAWALAEIDQDTVPEADPWPEVRRRVAAWRADRPGWRTGEIEATLDAFCGGADDQ